MPSSRARLCLREAQRAYHPKRADVIIFRSWWKCRAGREQEYLHYNDSYCATTVAKRRPNVQVSPVHNRALPWLPEWARSFKHYWTRVKSLCCKSTA